MAKSPPPAQSKPSKGGGFFKSITGAIDEVMAEVKADMKAMTPPNTTDDAKRAAAQAAHNSQMAGIVSQSTGGLQEITVPGDVPSLPPEPQHAGQGGASAAAAQTLPPGNLWQALTNPEYSARLHADACYQSLTVADIENYRRAINAEKTAPFTMGLAAITLQAPLEEEGDDSLAADDLLLTGLLKALEETRLYGAIGAGPRQIWPNLDVLDDALTNLLNNNPKLIALGPIGLDEPFAPYTIVQQQAQLAMQLEVAADFGVPVILTQRQSLAHMRQTLQGAQGSLPQLVWLEPIQSEEECKLVEDFAMYAVLRPELTTPGTASAEFYRRIAPNKLLLGSGSALVAPNGFAGHFNQPKFLKNTLTASARILGMSEDALLRQTNTNLAKLFTH